MFKHEKSEHCRPLVSHVLQVCPHYVGVTLKENIEVANCWHMPTHPCMHTRATEYRHKNEGSSNTCKFQSDLKTNLPRATVHETLVFDKKRAVNYRKSQSKSAVSLDPSLLALTKLDCRRRLRPIIGTVARKPMFEFYD